eukprot:IDg15301t1
MGNSQAAVSISPCDISCHFVRGNQLRVPTLAICTKREAPFRASALNADRSFSVHTACTATASIIQSVVCHRLALEQSATALWNEPLHGGKICSDGLEMKAGWRNLCYSVHVFIAYCVSAVLLTIFDMSKTLVTSPITALPYSEEENRLQRASAPLAARGKVASRKSGMRMRGSET